jgi:hypothetical protein
MPIQRSNIEVTSWLPSPLQWLGPGTTAVPLRSDTRPRFDRCGSQRGPTMGRADRDGRDPKPSFRDIPASVRRGWSNSCSLLALQRARWRSKACPTPAGPPLPTKWSFPSTAIITTGSIRAFGATACLSRLLGSTRKLVCRRHDREHVALVGQHQLLGCGCRPVLARRDDLLLAGSQEADEADRSARAVGGPYGRDHFEGIAVDRVIDRRALMPRRRRAARGWSARRRRPQVSSSCLSPFLALTRAPVGPTRGQG